MAPQRSKAKQSKKSTSASPSPLSRPPSSALRLSLQADLQHLRDRQQHQQPPKKKGIRTQHHHPHPVANDLSSPMSVAPHSPPTTGSSSSSTDESVDIVLSMLASHHSDSRSAGRPQTVVEYIGADVPIRLPCEGIVHCAVAVRVTRL